MKTPFIYGVAAEQMYFTDRENETKRLLLNFENGLNTIIISPRRWGKTSLVNRVSELMHDNPQVHVVHMDVFSVRTQEDFYRMFATEIIKQTATRAEELLTNAKRFLSSLVPVVTVSADPMNPISFSLKSISRDYGEEVLTLPERIAKEKDIHLIICIDEFQQIGELSDSITFQKKLRSVWQHQHAVSYCLYGSKRHLLMNMFGKRSYPFYKFGDMLFLERIPIEYWYEYIQSRFEQTDKHIASRFVDDIYAYVDGNSSYVQQLSWLVWSRTDKDVSEEILADAKQDLLRQNHALFMEQINSLTSYQLHFIRAIMAGKAIDINHKEIIDEFELGSSANVATIKKALQKKELIEIEGKKVSFSDPIFMHWLRQNKSLFT
jgi:AAA+ ATPase superfamily predicted ATPase